MGILTMEFEMILKNAFFKVKYLAIGIGNVAYLCSSYRFCVHFPTFPDGFRFGGFGVLLAPLQEHFKAPISSLAWAGSLSCGLLSLLGPLIGGLINKFGLRPVCIGTFLNNNQATKRS